LQQSSVKEDYDEEFQIDSSPNPSFMDDTFLDGCSAVQSSTPPVDEEELDRRAPYISMSGSDDLPLFDPSELFSGLDLECLPIQ
jgi:hypothetical protein